MEREVIRIEQEGKKPVTYKDLAIGDLFKIEGTYHTQVKAAYKEKLSWIKNPYHSAEHRIVVVLDADPNMEVTLVSKATSTVESINL